jgi:hypothetical protein
VFYEGRQVDEFDPDKLTATVEFRVSGGCVRRVVEVKVPSRGERYEPISGFS